MTDVRSIDDCLSARGGRLFVEESDTIELVEQFGSPHRYHRVTPKPDTCTQHRGLC